MAAKPLRTPAGAIIRSLPITPAPVSSGTGHPPGHPPASGLKTTAFTGVSFVTYAQRRWTQRCFRERALEGLSGWRDAHLVLPRAAVPCANGGGHRAAILALEPLQISPEEKSKCPPRSSHHHMVPNLSLSGRHKLRSAPHSVPVP